MNRNKVFFIVALLCYSVVSAQNTNSKIYNETINPMQQIDSAIVKAKAENKYVACQVGGNWCPWCLRFADFITTDSVVNKLVEDNFVYIHVNYNPRRSAGTEKLAEGRMLMSRLNNAGRFGYPVIVILDENGKVIHTQDSSFLEEGNGYDKTKVVRFFKNWTPKATKD